MKKTARKIILFLLFFFVLASLNRISAQEPVENKAFSAGLVCQQASLDSSGTLLFKLREILAQFKNAWPF